MPSLSEETGGRVSMLMPGSTIGIIGGGQLGRMMALSARYMGFRVGVLDPTPNCPTGQVADFQITAEYDDKTAIHDLAVQSDVLTYEFENVDADAIDEVRGITATPQGTDLLRVTQHRVREKQFINDHGTATAPFDELAVHAVLTYEFDRRRHRRGARHHRHPAGHRLAARDPTPRAREAVHQRPRHRHRTVARCQQLR